MSNHSLLILVAGPYRSGTGDDPACIATNLQAMTETALVLFRKGHVPLTGEAQALPLIEAAGSKAMGDTAWDAIFHPYGEKLVVRCDAVLRIGGASVGADHMMALAVDSCKIVYRALDEVPEVV